MAFADWIKRQTTQVKDGVKRFKSQSFLEAVTAGCAMVAFADGIIKPEEKAKMAGFIQRNEALSVFDMNQVIQSFEKHVKNFEFDPHIGKATALQTISKIGKNPDEARMLVRVCCAIGAADGDFDPDEKAVVREICQELSLDPAQFELGPQSPPSPPEKEKIRTDSPDMPDWMKKS